MKQKLFYAIVIAAICTGLWFGIPVIYREVCTWPNVSAAFFCLYAVTPAAIVIGGILDYSIQEVQGI